MALSDLLGSLFRPPAPSGFVEGEWDMANKVPAAPNVWNEPASSSSIFGLPVAPLIAGLLGGLGTAGLGYALSDKDSRNRNMIQGLFGGARVGYNLFNDPIERDRYERVRANELLIRQGWSPLHGPEFGTTPQTGATLPSDLGVPLLPPPMSEQATGWTLANPTSNVPKAPMGVRMGGMTFYAPPAPVRIKAGDVYSDLPPALANQEVTLTPDLLPEAIRGAREKKTEGFYRSQVPGFESAPLPVVAKEYDRMRAQQAAEKAIGMLPQGPNVTLKMRYDPASQTVIPEVTTVSEAETQLQRGQLDFQGAQLSAARERAQNDLLVTDAQLKREEAQRIAYEARRKEIEGRRGTVDLGRTIGGLETANANLRTSIGSINEEIGKLSLDPTMAKEVEERKSIRSKLQKEYDQNLSTIRTTRNKLNEQQGLPTIESEQPLDPVDEKIDAAMMRYNKLIVKDLPSIDSLDKLPKPKDGPEREGYEIAVEEARTLLDRYIPMIDQFVSKQWWDSNPPPELQAWIKGEIGEGGEEAYKFIMRNYNKGYRPASSVPPLPTGVVPPVPASSPLSQPMP